MKAIKKQISCEIDLRSFGQKEHEEITEMINKENENGWICVKSEVKSPNDSISLSVHIESPIKELCIYFCKIENDYNVDLLSICLEK